MKTFTQMLGKMLYYQWENFKNLEVTVMKQTLGRKRKLKIEKSTEEK